MKEYYNVLLYAPKGVLDKMWALYLTGKYSVPSIVDCCVRCGMLITAGENAPALDMASMAVAYPLMQTNLIRKVEQEAERQGRKPEEILSWWFTRALGHTESKEKAKEQAS